LPNDAEKAKTLHVFFVSKYTKKIHWKHLSGTSEPDKLGCKKQLAKVISELMND